MRSPVSPDTALQGDWGLPQRDKYRCGQESYTGIFAFVYTKALLANLPICTIFIKAKLHLACRQLVTSAR